MSFDLTELDYPARLNCAVVLLDQALDEGHAHRAAIHHRGEMITYGDLAARVNRIARVLVEDFDVAPGARILLRGENTPTMFACWLAIMKVGAIAVATMPLLRAPELKHVIRKSRTRLALCACELVEQMTLASEPGDGLAHILRFGADDAELEVRARLKPASFEAVATSQDDVCLIAFTSGTTGEPKAVMHFHRDVLVMCDTFARHILRPGPDAIFCGTPPIAFTFGLGGLLVFPLRFRACVALPDQSGPDGLLQAIQHNGVTHCFTSPTGYRGMLARASPEALASLKACVSAGEHLPGAVSDAWFAATGLRLIDGIGATEMMHIFISSRPEDARPGAIGKPVPGFSACMLDGEGQPVNGPGVGRLAVRGPTGCRYLADGRQTEYVQAGWNVTGDIVRRDENGYYWYLARSDDMIISSGYNIAGPEVEAALLLHPDVQECAVIGWPDDARGQVVKAVVVLRGGVTASESLAKALQDHVKATIAPYKYPRIVEFRESLPKTVTGKLQRSALRVDPVRSLA